MTGEAKSVSEACKLADVRRATFYELQKSGQFDELLSQMKQEVVTEALSRFASAVPDLMQGAIDDALNSEVSVRDRDQRARTALQYYKELASDVPEPATGEPASEWLARQGAKFQPIQIVGSTVHIQSPPATDEEVVEGSAEEVG